MNESEVIEKDGFIISKIIDKKGKEMVSVTKAKKVKKSSKK